MRHNFSVEGVAVVDEVIVRAHSTPDRIGHDLIKAGGFEVWTGPGKTGTALVVGTDFDLSVKDTKRTARAEFDIYTLFAVINATYLNTTLYLTYTSCGDYLSIENVGDAVCENITLAGTNGAVSLDAMVTGERRRYFKTGAYHASGYVFSASGATFEGRASVAIYGQYSFVEIERISATVFAVRDLSDKYQYSTVLAVVVSKNTREVLISERRSLAIGMATYVYEIPFTVVPNNCVLSFSVVDPQLNWNFTNKGIQVPNTTQINGVVDNYSESEQNAYLKIHLIEMI